MRITRATGSLPFVVSLLIPDGSLSPQQFSDEEVYNEQKQSVIRKVKGKVDPEIDENYPQMRQVRVEVVTKTGKTYSHKLDWFKEEPECPLSEHEIETKFMSLASGVLGEEKGKEIIAFVERLEEVGSIEPLLSLAVRREQ